MNMYLMKQAIIFLFLNISKIQNLINICFVFNSNELLRFCILIEFDLNFILN